MFSASLPPYLASAAISAIDHLEENPSLLGQLRENISLLRRGECRLLLGKLSPDVEITGSDSPFPIIAIFGNPELADVPGLTVSSSPLSPIVFLKLKRSTGSPKADQQLLEDIASRVRPCGRHVPELRSTPRRVSLTAAPPPCRLSRKTASSS